MPTTNNLPRFRVFRTLSVNHLKLLQILATARGPLTRSKLAERAEWSPGMIARLIGYSDDAKRATFERSKQGGGSDAHPNLSLLSMSFVKEITLDIDGLKETAITITPNGMAVLKQDT